MNNRTEIEKNMIDLINYQEKIIIEALSEVEMALNEYSNLECEHLERTLTILYEAVYGA